MSLIRKHGAVLQAWACLALVIYRVNLLRCVIVVCQLSLSKKHFILFDSAKVV